VTVGYTACPNPSVSAELAEGDLLWEPSETYRSGSRIADYMRWLAEHRGLRFETYDALWHWSVADLEAFWASVVEFGGVRFARPAERVLGARSMPGARWFEGAELNYAENVFRHAADDRPALLFQSETRPPEEMSWAQLEAQVAAIAAALRAMGVSRGDRVVAYMPNIPETVVAFLAAASLGAIWSSCSPDFGVNAVLDRFAQIEPTVLFAIDEYTYGGKLFPRQSTVRALQVGLPSLKHSVLVTRDPSVRSDRDEARGSMPTLLWDDLLAAHAATQLAFEPLPFDHPLWVLYSSGTTGLPKALVHSHGGVVVEHVKLLALHNDLRAGDRLFWYTSTGWMMWNFVVGGLLVGATPVLYDGNPAYPDLDTLWRLAAKTRLKLFGTSAAYLMSCRKASLDPGRAFDLSALRCVGSTGSPLPSEGFGWVYAHVKRDLWLASVSGGTDVVSAFVAGCPLLPVRAGELQCRALGASVDAFDEQGRSLIDETGELVITLPMPSMPIFLWNDDADASRYRASYFDMYPGVWRHGDWIRFTSRGSAVIQGRSDSTLNRLGVRVGTSEVYSAVEGLPEIRDSLVLGLELPDGGYYMPLFVVLAEGVQLDDELKRKINATIRTQCSPRHVPDQIVAVPAIPRTLSDKKMEVPVKKLFMGVPLEKAANVGATRSPAAVEYFADLARHTSPLLTRES
jgi:acetoacetyl-CoA synthetase